MIRLLFLVFLTGTALVFDHFHEADEKVAEEMENSGPGNSPEAFLFCLNPANHAGFKLQVPRPFLKKVYFESENKFLVIHHSLRANHFFKAEPLFYGRPLWLTHHHLNFSYFYSENPGDLPVSA